MSGYLGLLNAGVALLVRPAPLIIGDLVLEGHEVPGRISIGGAQAVTIHKTPGGGRTIDAMGSDPGTIVWRGVFVGPSAAQRARRLDFMRQQGSPYGLSFGDYMFNVVIIHFEYDYQDQGAVISYRIRTEIVPDLNAASGAASGLDVALQGDLSTAQVVLQAGAVVVSAYSALGGGGASGAASVAAMGSVAISLASTAGIAAVASAGSVSGQAQIQGGLTAAAATVSTAINAASTGSLAAPVAGLSFASASALAATTAQAAALAALVRSGGYINRTNSNVASTTAQLSAPLVHS